MAGLRAAGTLTTWLNIAGPTAPILPHYAGIGAAIATFDYYVEPAAARRLLPHTCLLGNLTSLDFLAPSPQALTAQARRLIAAFADRGGYILSSGCEIPPEAGEANVAALAQLAAGG
jgi:uroporphyrinogen decarboxylase